MEIIFIWTKNEKRVKKKHYKSSRLSSVLHGTHSIHEETYGQLISFCFDSVHVVKYLIRCKEMDWISYERGERYAMMIIYTHVKRVKSKINVQLAMQYTQMGRAHENNERSRARAETLFRVWCHESLNHRLWCGSKSVVRATYRIIFGIYWLYEIWAETVWQIEKQKWQCVRESIVYLNVHCKSDHWWHMEIDTISYFRLLSPFWTPLQHLFSLPLLDLLYALTHSSIHLFT